MRLVACVFCGIVICQLLSCTVAQSSLTDIHRIDSVNVNVDMEIEADGTAKPSSANHNDTYPSLQSVPTVQGRDGRRRIKLDALSTSERVNVVASIARMKRDKRKRELLVSAPLPHLFLVCFCPVHISNGFQFHSFATNFKLEQWRAD